MGFGTFQLFSIASDVQTPFGKSCVGQTVGVLLSVGQRYRGNQKIWIFQALKNLSISQPPFLNPSQKKIKNKK